MLQVALDMVDPVGALRVATELCRAKVIDIVEVGTPLIKFFGISMISLVKIRCPGVAVMADMKTMDVGSLEARIAMEAGAKLVSVLGAAANETIEEFVREVRELGGESVVDMIGVWNPLARARELAEAGVRPDYVNLHLGIDVQRKRGLTIEHLLGEARAIREALGSRIMVAGGIDEAVAKRLRGYPVDVVVVGRAITQSSNPVATASRIRAALLGDQ